VRPTWFRDCVGRAGEHLDAVIGGRARRHVVVVLACVLAVAAADQGALSATADQIHRYFAISRTDLGLLGTITTAVSAAATLPFGVLVDRVVRTRLLGCTVVVWSAAMVVSGTATSYLYLLTARVLLGMVVAVAYPAAASLIGDYFPPAERGRIYGYVLTGELIGTGLGIALAAASSLLGGWRAAMFASRCPPWRSPPWCCGCPNRRAAGPAGCRWGSARSCPRSGWSRGSVRTAPRSPV
jgi:MFS family permease